MGFLKCLNFVGFMNGVAFRRWRIRLCGTTLNINLRVSKVSMARSKNVGRRLALLAVLLGAVALFAAVSVINVTYWYVNTTAFPVSTSAATPRS